MPLPRRPMRPVKMNPRVREIVKLKARRALEKRQERSLRIEDSVEETSEFDEQNLDPQQILEAMQQAKANDGANPLQNRKKLSEEERAELQKEQEERLKLDADEKRNAPKPAEQLSTEGAGKGQGGVILLVIGIIIAIYLIAKYL